MNKKEITKRYILFIISLFFIALGIAFTKKSILGISPNSSIPNVFSLRFTHVSLGTWLILYNVIMVILQVLILRRDFKLIQLLQIPLSVVFGYFTDFGVWCLSSFEIHSYIMQLVMVFIGVIVLAFGIALSVIANVIMNSAEAFVKAISDRTGKKFGNVKVVVDIANVAISVILSLVFFGGEIIGTREGTFISAVCTGLVVKVFIKLLEEPVSRLLEK